VIFDYGGVLSQSPFHRLAQVEVSLELAPGTLSDLLGYGIDVPEAEPGQPITNKWHLLEMGAIDVSEYADWVKERSVAAFGAPVDLAGRFSSGLGSMGIHWMVVAKVRELRERGYAVAICTNNIAVFRDTWHAQLPLELFDVVVDSSEVGVRKPDPAIYLLTCERLGVSPDACVFVDDHPGNIAAAEALGMSGVVVGADPWAALGVLDAVLAS
jgi:putative hydrolase of the HAD superfamily